MRKDVQSCQACPRLRQAAGRPLFRAWLSIAATGAIALLPTVLGSYMGMSAQPSYQMLGRLGHELLTKTEHAYASALVQKSNHCASGSCASKLYEP